MSGGLQEGGGEGRGEVWGGGGGRLKLCCVSLQLLSVVVVVVCAGLLAHQTGQPQVSEAGEERDRVLTR